MSFFPKFDAEFEPSVYTPPAVVSPPHVTRPRGKRDVFTATYACVVTPNLLADIRAKAVLAESDRQVRAQGGEATPRLTKGSCPESGLPNDTILSKLANDKFTQTHDYERTSGAKFAVLSDQTLPFFGSVGPNIVQVFPSETTINLFSLQKRRDFAEYLTRFNQFRNDNIVEIAQAYANTIQGARKQDGQLFHKTHLLTKEHSEWLLHFQNVMLKLITYIKGSPHMPGKALSEAGMSMSSFCQTWMRNDVATDDAQFSIMSPHFQTKFNVVNIENMASKLHLDAKEKEAVSHLCDPMGIQFITMGGLLPTDAGTVELADYTGAFVDVDHLIHQYPN